MVWSHYIYQHIRKDTGAVFYVGKGSYRKNRSPSYERAYDKTHARNPLWKNIANKHGFDVVIFAHCITDEDAQCLEKKLIAKIGRRDLGKGSLVNFTDGGDGHCGIIVSDELRRKRSESSKGKRSEAWVAAIRRSRKNGGNGGVVRKGDKLSTQWCQHISDGQKGPNNYMRGRAGGDHPNAKKVLDVDTNRIYPSIQEAADQFGYKMKTLYNWLSGHRKNPTHLRFA